MGTRLNCLDLSIQTSKLLGCALMGASAVIRLITVILFYCLQVCLQIAGRVANSVGLDQTPRSVASDLGLHCLPMPVYPNILAICLE